MLLLLVLTCACAFISDVALNNCVSKPASYQCVSQEACIFQTVTKVILLEKNWDGIASAEEMDFRAEFKWPLEAMEWKDVISTLEAMVMDLLKDASIPTHTPPPPVLAVLQSDDHPHPSEDLSGRHCECAPLEAAPNWFQQPSPMMTDLELNKPHTRHCSWLI